MAWRSGVPTFTLVTTADDGPEMSLPADTSMSMSFPDRRAETTRTRSPMCTNGAKVAALERRSKITVSQQGNQSWTGRNRRQGRTGRPGHHQRIVCAHPSWFRPCRPAFTRTALFEKTWQPSLFRLPRVEQPQRRPP